MPTTTDVLTSPHAPPDRRTRWWPWVATALRVGLAAVALTAGVSKIVDLPASVRSVRAYELLPEALAVVVGNGLPMAEILLGVLLLLGLFTRASSIVFGALMVVFTVGIASAWARGLSIDCGCFTPGGQIEPDQTAYPQEIARDVVFLAAAAALAYRPRSRYSLDDTLDLH